MARREGEPDDEDESCTRRHVGATTPYGRRFLHAVTIKKSVWTLTHNG
jgi:hypothetical protein